MTFQKRLRGVAPCSFVALALLLFDGHFALRGWAQPPAIQYVYDALNRLIAVVDQQGNAAMYTYDAVGNILRIDRVNAVDLPGRVAISFVTPGRARVGRTVTILGKGFGSTANQNSVAFNGTPAVVSSAATNRITTIVPAGATTGPITVTTPTGSASSPTPFGVIGAVTVTPTNVTAPVGAVRQFSATEDGTTATSVVWSVNGNGGGDPTVGTISQDGTYTAPAAVPTPAIVTVAATDRDDPSMSASTSVTIIPPQQVTVVADVSVSIAPRLAVNQNITSSVSVGVAPRLVVDQNITSSVSVGIAPRLVVDQNITSSVSVGFTLPLSGNFVEALPVAVSVEPVITALSPVTVGRGVSVPITITGSGFSGASTLLLLLNNSTDNTISVTDLTVSPDGTQAQVNIVVASTSPTGVRVVQIATPAGQSTQAGTGGNVLTVQ